MTTIYILLGLSVLFTIGACVAWALVAINGGTDELDSDLLPHQDGIED